MLALGCTLLAIYFYFGEKRWLSVFLMFFVITAGFQMVPVQLINLPPAGITKPYDWMWLFTGAVVLFRPQVFANLAVWRQFRWVGLFIMILVVLLMYSIFWKEIEVPVTIRVFRNFLFFITLFLFVPLPQADLEKIFRLIIYATSIACVLYCLQTVLHRPFLNKVTNDMTSEGGFANVTRYYNVPVLICPVIFFLFFPKQAFQLKFRNYQLAICSITVLLTQHRNLIISVMFCYFLYLVMSRQVKPLHAIMYCAFGVGLLLAADNFLGNRLSKGMDDLGKSSSSNRPVIYHDVALSDLSTTEFRRLLFMERLHYILKDETRSVFGLGLMTDDSQKARSLRFYIGIPDDDGNISQIANVDIAWASLLLQLGLAGTISFIILHLVLLKNFMLKRSNPYLCVGLFFLVSLLVSSLYGSMIAMPYTMCMTMLFAAYYYHLTTPETWSIHLWKPSISQ